MFESKRPFWGGERGAKACCEGRVLLLCGRRVDFPSDTLKDMGRGAGSGPAPKLAWRRAWARAEKEGGHAQGR